MDVPTIGDFIYWVKEIIEIFKLIFKIFDKGNGGEEETTEPTE